MVFLALCVGAECGVDDDMMTLTGDLNVYIHVGKSTIISFYFDPLKTGSENLARKSSGFLREACPGEIR